MRRGRPILIAIRIPDSVEYCQAIGLDVEKWLAEGLVDLLSGSCYFQLNPWEYLVGLGHRYGVPVYPSLSESRVLGETRFARSSLESYRARALQAWAAGADGIYMFNYFDPRGQLWRELGDRQTLATRDKLYFVTPRDGPPDSYLAGGRQYQHLPILTPTNPWPVVTDQPAEVELAVGDDLARAQRTGHRAQVTCHLRALGSVGLQVALNGQALAEPTVTGEWRDYPVPADLVKTGSNHFAISTPDVPAPDEAWTTVYEAGKLPESPWTKDGPYVAQGCVTEMQNGKLLIADRSTESGGYAYFRCPCFLRPSDENVIEARLKVLSGWSSVLIENGRDSEEVTFHPDHVQGRYSGVSYAMDTTDAFHTYRILVKDRGFKVYVDGELRLDGTDRMTYPAWNGRSGAAFGAANSGSLGEALWESVRVRTRAVALLDLALAIRYDGK
jgi:hypothetical protein